MSKRSSFPKIPKDFYATIDPRGRGEDSTTHNRS